MGNSSLNASRYGTPPSSILDSSGNISAANYLTNASAVASGFGSVASAAGLTIVDGQIVYLCETYLSTPNLSFLGTSASNGVYARSIF